MLYTSNKSGQKDIFISLMTKFWVCPWWRELQMLLERQGPIPQGLKKMSVATWLFLACHLRSMFLLSSTFLFVFIWVKEVNLGGSVESGFETKTWEANSTRPKYPNNWPLKRMTFYLVFFASFGFLHIRILEGVTSTISSSWMYSMQSSRL